ncbi:MAG TPA: hypothetical protein VK399_02995 [Longimicrobiaceae bacterium]|jgi:hypothetical protein|nr:hypothetical protein [Longimicrobiaceae bacterium]
MPLSRALLPAGALAALLLGGCAAPPPPASAPLPAGMARVLLPAELQPLLDGSVVDGSLAAALDAPRGRCDPGDPMAFDPGPRVDSLAIRRVPGGEAGPMPNACPVDARFQVEQAGRLVRIRGTNSKVPR